MKIWKIDQTEYTFINGEMSVYRSYTLFTSRKKAEKHADSFAKFYVESANKRGEFNEIQCINKSICDEFILLKSKIEYQESEKRIVREFILTDAEVQ